MLRKMGIEIKIAKASKLDIQSTESLLELLEQIFYGEDIEQTPVFKKVKEELCYYFTLSDEELAAVQIEMIRRYFNNCSGRWVKVINTADVMIDQICSKEVGFIELTPFLKRASNNTILGE